MTSRSDELNANRQVAMMILSLRFPDKDERELAAILDEIDQRGRAGKDLEMQKAKIEQ